MTVQVSVQGGTHAGWRTVREQRREPWTCACGYENKPTHANCWNDCGGRRP